MTENSPPFAISKTHLHYENHLRVSFITNLTPSKLMLIYIHFSQSKMIGVSLLISCYNENIQTTC